MRTIAQLHTADTVVRVPCPFDEGLVWFAYEPRSYYR
jgi:hypothetical protein